MSNISFVIFTYNEEKRISYVVRNFIKYGEVIILDYGSTDRTKEIVENLGARYIVRPKQTIVVENPEMYDFVKKCVKTDWIYWGYADNIAPKKLLEKLVEVSIENKFKRVYVPLYTYLWGNVKNYAIKTYAPVVFHKEFIDFTDNRIHGMGKFLGTEEQVLKLPSTEEYALRHFSTYNMSKFVQSHLNYAEMEALEKFKAGEKFSIREMLVSMIRHGISWGKYSLKGGVYGLIILLSYVFFRFMMYAKLFELENGITLESIENNYSVAKEKILGEYK